jgi:hypothetical protein
MPLSRLSCLLVAATILALSLASTAGAKPRIGMSDQNVSTFSNPDYQALGIKYVRYILPWDVALHPDDKPMKDFETWLAAATAARAQVMVAFERKAGDNCPHEPCTLPTPDEYQAAFLAFRERFPAIRLVTPWNEANAPTQPTYRKPYDAALYYKRVAENCRRCTIVAADVLDNTMLTRSTWLDSFYSVTKSMGLKPRVWGLHNWGDVNHFTTRGIDKVLDTVKGSVWLTETGGIVAFTTADGRQNFHPSERRASKAMRHLFRKIVPISGRIKRVYIYNWESQPTNRWDTGLIDHSGNTRGMYSIVSRFIKGR